jgi:hypothetical protein
VGDGSARERIPIVEVTVVVEVTTVAALLVPGREVHEPTDATAVIGIVHKRVTPPHSLG